MADANQGHVIAYGSDPYTDFAVQKFREHFGDGVDVYFVFGGTGANVLGLTAVTESYRGIICTRNAHINVDELGAVEKFAGCKLLTVPPAGGKISVDQIRHLVPAEDDHRNVRPRLISISQATELGTIYTQKEIRALSEFAHEHNMLLHVDGARLSNAAAGLNLTLREITADAGVDVLSFGGTKNGSMYGEAVVFFDKELSRKFKYVRNQGTHLASKMRFISAQFAALLSDDLWHKNASHANRMATLLAAELEQIPQIKITQKVQSNGVFAQLPGYCVPLLQEKYFFYLWNEDLSEARLMSSFDTTEDDVRGFIQSLKEILASAR